MRMTGSRLLLAAAGIMATGCINPFDPSADVRLERFFANGGLIAIINQSTALANVDSNGASEQTVNVAFSNFTTVGGQITSYSVVYRQLTAQPAPVNLEAGSPIPSLGGAAGRRFYTLLHFQGLRDNTNPVEYTTFTLFPRIITAEVMKYIGSGLGASAIGGGIDCECIFYGEDHNGHDIKVSGVLHVQID